MERCDKAPMGLECVDKLGHAGKCSCIKAEAFNAAVQDAEDEFLWGGFKVVPNPHIPTSVIGIFNGKPNTQILEMAGYLRPQPMTTYDQWVEASAEFEAKALEWWNLTRQLGQTGAVKWLSNDETGALVIVTRGEYRETLMRAVRQLEKCTKCDGTGWLQPDVAIEVCECMQVKP